MTTDFEDRSQQSILRAMVAMAVADKDIEDDEIDAICEIYKKVSGGNIPNATVRSVVGEFQSGSHRITEELRSISESLDPEVKEAIIRGCYLVLLADSYIAAEERKRLTDIARALQLQEIHYKMILEELEAEG